MRDPSLRVFALIALPLAFVLTWGMVGQPGFPDAFYHFNAANRLVLGDGFVDDYLWTYIGQPESLPAPSHLYWMPLTSVVSAAGMWALNRPGEYRAAQVGLALLLFAGSLIAYGLGRRLGGRARHGWTAGLITLTGGFFVRFWGATDTFTPYLVVGSLTLVTMGLGLSASRRRWLWWTLAGVFVALGHLTRNDALLLVAVGWAVLLWPWDFRRKAGEQRANGRERLTHLALFTAAYLLVMTPWFARNLNALGSPLPVGGTQAIWFTQYADLFNYPPDASPQTFFADGFDAFWRSRGAAAEHALQTFVGVEGMVILTPLMLLGGWRRRGDRFLRAFGLYALGVHLALTLLFPYPSINGALFHAVVALLPFWAALAAAGLDDLVDIIARRRRHWRPRVAKPIFTAGLVLVVLAITFSIGWPARFDAYTLPLYRQLTAILPEDARVMINDPSQLYYYTGMGGVVLPNEPVNIIPAIAERYGVTHLVLEQVQDAGWTPAAPAALAFDVDAPPSFLTPLDLDLPGVRLYAIHP